MRDVVDKKGDKKSTTELWRAAGDTFISLGDAAGGTDLGWQQIEAKGETVPGRKALVEEDRIHGKATSQDVTTNSKHPALDTSLSSSVRTNRDKDNRRRITPLGLDSAQWHRRWMQLYMCRLCSVCRDSSRSTHKHTHSLSVDVTVTSAAEDYTTRMMSLSLQLINH